MYCFINKNTDYIPILNEKSQKAENISPIEPYFSIKTPKLLFQGPKINQDYHAAVSICDEGVFPALSPSELSGQYPLLSYQNVIIETQSDTLMLIVQKNPVHLSSSLAQLYLGDSLLWTGQATTQTKSSDYDKIPFCVGGQTPCGLYEISGYRWNEEEEFCGQRRFLLDERSPQKWWSEDLCSSSLEDDLKNLNIIEHWLSWGISRRADFRLHAVKPDKTATYLTQGCVGIPQEQYIALLDILQRFDGSRSHGQGSYFSFSKIAPLLKFYCFVLIGDYKLYQSNKLKIKTSII